MNSTAPDLQSNTGKWRIVRWLRRRKKNYSYTNGTMEVFYDTELQKVICSNSEQWQVDSWFELWWSLCLCVYFYELVHLVVVASLTDRVLIFSFIHCSQQQFIEKPHFVYISNLKILNETPKYSWTVNTKAMNQILNEILNWFIYFQQNRGKKIQKISLCTILNFCI